MKVSSGWMMYDLSGLFYNAITKQEQVMSITLAEANALNAVSPSTSVAVGASCTPFANDINLGCIIYRDEDTTKSLYKKVPYGDYNDLRVFNTILNEASWHDAVDAILIAPYTVVILYSSENFKGKSLMYINNSPNCGVNRRRFYTDKFNDSADSMKVLRLKPTNAEAFQMCNTLTGFAAGPYQRGTPLCETTIPLNYCVNENGIAADPACRSWAKNNTAVSDALATQYCNNPANAADPFCSCLNSPTLKLPGKVLAPQLLDAKCLADGYVTTTMGKINSINNLDCSTQLTFNNDGSIVKANTFKVDQNCNLNAGGGAGQTTTEKTQPPSWNYAETTNPIPVVPVYPVESNSGLLDSLTPTQQYIALGGMLVLLVAVIAMPTKKK